MIPCILLFLLWLLTLGFPDIEYVGESNGYTYRLHLKGWGNPLADYLERKFK